VGCETPGHRGLDEHRPSLENGVQGSGLLERIERVWEEESISYAAKSRTSAGVNRQLPKERIEAAPECQGGST
jgi:hypothetical protein